MRDAKKAELAGAIVLCPPSSLQDRWSRRFPDPVSAFASGWMRVRARARQRGVELPLVISDHADWDGLSATIAATGAAQIWVTHGDEEALVHWCTMRGLGARPLDIVGYGEEERGRGRAAPTETRSMNRFAALLDRLAYEPAATPSCGCSPTISATRPIPTAATRSRRSPARSRSATPSPASSAR